MALVKRTRWRLTALIAPLIALAAPAWAARPEGAAVILEREVRFQGGDGAEVRLEPGNYYVSVGDQPPLIVRQEFRDDAHELAAVVGKHEEKLEEPVAESIASDGEHHLVLLLPDGRSVDAVGSAGAVAGRSAEPISPEAVKQYREQREARRQLTTRSELAPRVADDKQDQTGWTEGRYRDQIILKIHEGPAVRVRPGASPDAPGTLELDERATDNALLQRNHLTLEQVRSDLTTIRALLSGSGVESWEALFDRDPLFLDEERLLAQQLSQAEQADLANFYLIVLSDEGAGQGLVDGLNAVASVEVAYFAPIPVDADVPPETPSFETQQHYLDPAPDGIDARFAWTLRGGRGAGVRVIDIEQGWNFTHEDFPGRFFPDPRYRLHQRTAGQNSTSCGSRQHGTAVLGEIVAINDGRGVTGIAADAGWGTVSPQREYSRRGHRYRRTRYRLPEALNVAAAMLGSGDVILIEQHMQGPRVTGTGNNKQMSDSGQACKCNCGQFGFVPMEYERATYDAIRNATARGITVVEASGNGDMDLDHARYRLRRGGRSRFDRSVRDSGAILVGASNGASRDPACWTNHGSMVDVHSWGLNVVTTGYGFARCSPNAPVNTAGWEVNGAGDDNQWYTKQFSGTSSASPIITGAVLVTNGARRARGMQGLSPREMRDLLKDPVNSTPQGHGGPDGAKQIGPQPDLKKAIRATLGTTGGATTGAGSTDSGDASPPPPDPSLLE